MDLAYSVTMTMDSAIKRLENVAEHVMDRDLDDAVAAVKRAWEQTKRAPTTPAVVQRRHEDEPWRPHSA
jgi:hypothetical protein